MPDVAFSSSEPLTLGIEEEFLLVDAADGIAPAPRVTQLLEGAYDTVPSPGGWLKAELLRSSVELATAASADLLQLDVDLRALRDELVARAQANDMLLVALGMHPDLRVGDELVSPTRAHEAIASLHRRVGTLAEQVTHGIHVHVGVPSIGDAIRVMDALAGCVPLFIAATANSPVVDGRRSPWRSARSDVLRRMLWAGPTPRIADADEYAAVHQLHQLENAAEQRFLWEVAPVPALGTVEVRSFDSQPDPDVTLAMAALVQGIAALVLAGTELPRANESLERHNRWSAMEFGLRARMLVPGSTEPVDASRLLLDLVELVRPYARELGSELWLAPIERLVAAPPIDAAVEAFERGGVAALIEHSRVRRAEPDPGAT